ncbi:MAG TPA: cytochrome c [Thermoanaerobaculia bacterium]|nr:cytochrome c [Thermoanaerobaculia bacterium]
MFPGELTSIRRRLSEAGVVAGHSDVRLGLAQLTTVILAIAGAILLAGCRPPQKMGDQPKYDPYMASDFFPDGQSARPAIAGTVARGYLHEDSFLNTGKVNGAVAEGYPFPVTEEVVTRGRQRFDIYCSECHGRVGRGDGMIVRRGYRRPPSFHTKLLRSQPSGHFFDVMTNGFGAMPQYGTMIPVNDRWAITAYVRALQMSQNAVLDDVPPSQRGGLQGGVRP